MRHLPSIAIAAVLFATPSAAQPEDMPPASASDSSPEIEQASYCAALKTQLGVLLGMSSKPNPVLQEKLKRSSVRWLNHANAAVDQSTPKGRVLVLDRYSAHSDALSKERFTMEPAAVREAMTNGLTRCEKAEREIFGNSYKDL